MKSQDREKLEHYFSALFNSNFDLPSSYEIKCVLHKFVMDDDFPAFAVHMLIKFIEVIEKGFDEIIKNSYENSQTIEDRSYQVTDCLRFFELILCDKYVPNDEDNEFFLQRFLHYAQCSNVKDIRVLSVLSLLVKLKYHCEEIPHFLLNAPCKTITFDSKHCSCYEYQMSGDCYHLDDDVFESETEY